MKAALRQGGEQWDGYTEVEPGHCRSKWKPTWIVEVQFDSERAAMKFCDEIRKREPEHILSKDCWCNPTTEKP